MATKLAAAKIAAWSGVRAVIAAADAPDVLADAIAGRAVGTAFRARDERLPSRKLWIAFAMNPAGRVLVDDGARRALCTDHRSLLPAGVRGVEGVLRGRRRGRDRRLRAARPSRRAWSGTPPRCSGGSSAGRRRSSVKACPTRWSTATTSWSCPADTRLEPAKDNSAQPPLRAGPASVTLLPHELVVDRRGESPLTRASAVGEEREEGEAGSPGPLHPSGKRGRRATRPHPSRYVGTSLPVRRHWERAPRPKGPVPQPDRGRRIGGMSSPTPVAELGRRARAASAALASASTADKDAALLAAADLLEQRTDDLLAANRLDVEAAEAAGLEAGPARPAAPHRGADRGDGRRPARRRRACPTRSARCSTGGVGPTGCGSNAGGCRSASSRSSTRTDPTSPATPPASASSRATSPSCAAPPVRCAPTSPSPRRCATG